jgi:hypothetical protein
LCPGRSMQFLPCKKLPQSAARQGIDRAALLRIIGGGGSNEVHEIGIVILRH